MANYNGEWFTPLDNGLWKDNKTGAIGRLKKGRGAGWYVDSEDQTPMGKREQYQKGQHINEYNMSKKQLSSKIDMANKKYEKAKTEPEWEKAKHEKELWQNVYDDVEKDEDFWSAYDNSKEETNISDLVGKHINKEQQLSDIGNKERRLQDGKEIHEVYRQMSDKEMKEFAEKNPEAIQKMKEYTRDKYDYDLYKRAKENPDSIDPMTENSTDWEALDKKYKDRYVKDVMDGLSVDKGFSQDVDMNGSVRLYNQNELKKMEEAGVKPMEHSYTGGGWEGTKYDSKLTTKEIAKTVQDDLKKNYPGVKISRKTDYNSIDINIMSSDKDLYKSSSDIDKMNDKTVSDTIRDSIGGYTRMDDWLEKNNRKSANGTFTTNDERDYLKEELETYRNRQGSRVSGGEWYLSDYGKEVVGSLNKNLNSYNYNDSDGMVDYFDTNFYGGVQIGKWDKPFVVKDKKIEAKIERYKKRKNK